MNNGDDKFPRTPQPRRTIPNSSNDTSLPDIVADSEVELSSSPSPDSLTPSPPATAENSRAPTPATPTHSSSYTSSSSHASTPTIPASPADRFKSASHSKITLRTISEYAIQIQPEEGILDVATKQTRKMKLSLHTHASLSPEDTQYWIAALKDPSLVFKYFYPQLLCIIIADYSANKLLNHAAAASKKMAPELTKIQTSAAVKITLIKKDENITALIEFNSIKYNPVVIKDDDEKTPNTLMLLETNGENSFSFSLKNIFTLMALSYIKEKKAEFIRDKLKIKIIQLFLAKLTSSNLTSTANGLELSVPEPQGSKSKPQSGIQYIEKVFFPYSETLSHSSHSQPGTFNADFPLQVCFKNKRPKNPTIISIITNERQEIIVEPFSGIFNSEPSYSHQLLYNFADFIIKTRNSILQLQALNDASNKKLLSLSPSLEVPNSSIPYTDDYSPKQRILIAMDAFLKDLQIFESQLKESFHKKILAHTALSSRELTEEHFKLEERLFNLLSSILSYNKQIDASDFPDEETKINTIEFDKKISIIKNSIVYYLPVLDEISRADYNKICYISLFFHERAELTFQEYYLKLLNTLEAIDDAYDGDMHNIERRIFSSAYHNSTSLHSGRSSHNNKIYLETHREDSIYSQLYFIATLLKNAVNSTHIRAKTITGTSISNENDYFVSIDTLKKIGTILDDISLFLSTKNIIGLRLGKTIIEIKTTTIIDNIRVLKKLSSRLQNLFTRIDVLIDTIRQLTLEKAPPLLATNAFDTHTYQQIVRELKGVITEAQLPLLLYSPEATTDKSSMSSASVDALYEYWHTFLDKHYGLRIQAVETGSKPHQYRLTQRTPTYLELLNNQQACALAPAYFQAVASGQGFYGLFLETLAYANTQTASPSQSSSSSLDVASSTDVTPVFRPTKYMQLYPYLSQLTTGNIHDVAPVDNGIDSELAIIHQMHETIANMFILNLASDDKDLPIFDFLSKLKSLYEDIHAIWINIATSINHIFEPPIIPFIEQGIIRAIFDTIPLPALASFLVAGDATPNPIKSVKNHLLTMYNGIRANLSRNEYSFGNETLHLTNVLKKIIKSKRHMIFNDLQNRSTDVYPHVDLSNIENYPAEIIKAQFNINDTSFDSLNFQYKKTIMPIIESMKHITHQYQEINYIFHLNKIFKRYNYLEKEYIDAVSGLAVLMVSIKLAYNKLIALENENPLLAFYRPFSGYIHLALMGTAHTMINDAGIGAIIGSFYVLLHTLDCHQSLTDAGMCFTYTQLCLPDFDLSVKPSELAIQTRISKQFNEGPYPLSLSMELHEMMLTHINRQLKLYQGSGSDISPLPSLPTTRTLRIHSVPNLSGFIKPSPLTSSSDVTMFATATRSHSSTNLHRPPPADDSQLRPPARHHSFLDVSRRATVQGGSYPSSSSSFHQAVDLGDPHRSKKKPGVSRPQSSSTSSIPNTAPITRRQ